MANLASSLDHMMSLIGRECVYKERGLFLHGKLIGVSIKEEMMELKFQRIPSPGFSKRQIRTFAYSSIREFVNFKPNRICGPMIGTEIFFRPDEVKELVRFMSTMPTDQSLMRKIRDYRA